MRILFLILLSVVSVQANAACRWIWSDHDMNTSTPAIRKQVCDSSIDMPTFDTPSIQPIQTPTIKPLPSFGIPPIGTTRCRNERVYENGRWVNKRICS